MDVLVIDELMGQGKTTWIINLVNILGKDKRILAVVPYKEQYRRLNLESKGRLKMIDDNTPRKTPICKLLIESNEDLVITHALYKLLPLEILNILKAKNYKVIFDETLSVIEDLKVKQADITMLIKSNRIEVDEESKKVTWIGEDNEEGSFEDVKLACVNYDVYAYGGQYTALIALLPEYYFKGFNQVFICTYLFDYQLITNHFEFYNITYEKKSLVQHGTKKYPEPYNEFADNRAAIYKKIEINQNIKHNHIGRLNGSLSRKSLENKAIQKQLKKNFNTYCKGIEAKSSEVMWTVFKCNRDDIKGDGYTKGFVPCNAKASNDFQHKSVLMYGCNIFVSPVIMNFFAQRGITINQEQYAVSELLQWIWRSRIRNGESIKLYLPSKRMRDALEQWSEYEL